VTTVNVHEAKTHLSRLIEALVSGREKEITIARNGVPAVTMTAAQPERKPRVLGLGKGKYTLVEDFDRDNDVIAKMFEGEPDW
jgi:antitoxin (DNA-binding transcriptional repressor) of toxin-antitoxin stability system